MRPNLLASNGPRLLTVQLLPPPPLLSRRQMFYDADLFINWVRRVRAAGITVPIVPGIMPIQSFATFTKWVARENILVPQHFYDALLPVKDDDARVREVGTKLVGDMCRAILAADVGITGLHIYTLNLAVGARMLLEEVGLIPKAEQVNPLPWTPSLTPARRGESIRPIVRPARLPLNRCSSGRPPCDWPTDLRSSCALHPPPVLGQPPAVVPLPKCVALPIRSI